MDKRLIDGTADVNQLMPIKYHWAYQAYLEEVAAHWTPEVVNMSKDIALWKSDKLTDQERLMVKRNLGFFSTADSLAANNIVLNTYRHITAPEARMFMLRQAATEALHTASYGYIIESLGLDQEEVFNAYNTVPCIKAKDDFLMPFIETTGSLSKPSDKDLAAAIFVFGAIMEGLFFYVGFAQILALGRQNKMVGACEQYDFITRDEVRHCQFGMNLFNGIMQENPHLDTWVMSEHLRDLMHQGVELEYAYALDTIGDGTLGISADTYLTYLRHIANRRCEYCNLGTLYEDNAHNPFPWMSAAIDLPKNKNFFETRVVEYSNEGLDWE